MASLCVKFNEDRVHELYPEASMVPAMKMWTLPKNKRDRLAEFADNGDYLASLKVDGYCYTLNRTPNYTYLFSRSPGVNGLLTEKIDRVPHIQQAALNLPPDTLIMGEIYVPGGTSKNVTSIMGCLAPRAIARQKAQGYLSYYLVDIITLDGVDLRNVPFKERAVILKTVYNQYLVNYQFITLAEQIDTNIYETAMEWIAQGEEGAVLRKKDSLYVPDGRPAWSSIKIKPEETLDVIITGFEDPTKEYKGNSGLHWEYWVMEHNDKVFRSPIDNWVEKERWTGHHRAIRSPEYRTIPVTKAYYYNWKNAITIAAYNKEGNLENIGTISSGLTDELRAAFAEEPEKYLNRVIEVKCMSVDTKGHTLRHGFFLKFRDDKNPEDCLITDIFG